MSSSEIRVGLRVAWYENSKRYEGVICGIMSNGNAIIEPDDLTLGFTMMEPSRLRIPLHDGVFASDENFNDWIAQYRAAQAKFAAALATGALDKIDESIDVPEEIVRTIKQVIAVLGTEEAIRFFTSLFKK